MGTAFTSCPLKFKEVYFLKIKVCILSVFLSVLLLFSNFSVKANDVVFPAFPEPVEGRSSTHYLITFNSVTGNYVLYKPLDPQTMYVTIQDNDLVLNFVSGPTLMYIWKAGEGGNSWIKAGEKGISPTSRTVIVSGYNEGTVEFLYSSFDLYYSDDTLFFQRAPIKANFLTQMKRVQMGATMKTLVSLIPLSIVLVVSLIAFRKAWAWLLKVLHKA